MPIDLPAPLRAPTTILGPLPIKPKPPKPMASYDQSTKPTAKRSVGALLKPKRTLLTWVFEPSMDMPWMPSGARCLNGFRR